MTLFPSEGELSGGYVFGGSGQDTLNFSAGVNNRAIVSADAGSDVLVFSSTIATASNLRWFRWRQHDLEGCYFQQHH